MNLFDPPGRPFGYTWLEERTKIEDHVLRRTKHQIPLYDMRVQFRVQKIQDRLHKYDPTFRERQAKWNAEQAARPKTEMMELTQAELEHLADLFAGANDPLSASIGEKARIALGTVA